MAAPRLHLANSSRSTQEDSDNESPIPMTGSTSNPSQMSENPNRQRSLSVEELPHRVEFADEGELRRDLRFFFLDPIEKYHARKQFPWKLTLQILKIVVVTIQIVMFGDMRMSHVDFVEQTGFALKHFMLKDWEAGRDIRAYPPNYPDYSIYTVSSFYDHLTFAVQKYYILNVSTFSTWMYDYPSLNDSRVPPLTFCAKQFKAVDVNLHNESYYFDTTEIERCIPLDLSESQYNSSDFSMHVILNNLNFTIDHERMTTASLSFNLKTVHIRKKQPSNLPDCFLMNVALTFDNTAHSGQVIVDIENVVQHLACNGAYLYSDFPAGYKISVVLVDILVLFVCICSLALCLRALIRAEQLKRRTRKYFSIVFEVKMTKDEQLMFLNLWYVLILVNDVCLIVGTICKFTIEYKIIGSTLFTFTGMLLGLGTLFVWVGVLRYFGFFSHYNILILTLKKAFPNVLRFMVCAGLLYMGFLFCGWVVLGPYHMKFRTLLTASACLFALINGDDMFATFTTTSEESPSVVWFARIYLYIFISLFIYIVLSLFISIIMDAYEVVKDHYQNVEEPSYLKEFIAQSANMSFPAEHASCKDSFVSCWRSLKLRVSHYCGWCCKRGDASYCDLNSSSTAINA